jgi:murein tripeptide amidase MpaA
MNELARSHKDIVTVKTIGTTFQNRKIMALELNSKNPAMKVKGRTPVVVLECGIHAREWLSPAVCLYLIDHLIANPHLMANETFAIVPVLNPDGYFFTHEAKDSTHRYWRKNRVPTGRTTCEGVDINRNFPYQFEDPGSFVYPCPEWFQGTAPKSEAETQSLMTYIDAMIDDPTRWVKAYFSVHNWHQAWMFPYGFNKKAADHDRLQTLSNVAVKSIESFVGTKYTAASIYDTLNKTASYGSSTDYFYSRGVLNAFAIELRDTGIKEFDIPENEIRPTALEFWEGVKAVLSHPLINY